MIYGNPIIANFNSAPSNTWAELRASTRAGTAATDFPLGTELPITFDSTYQNTTAVVVGYDKYTPADSNLTHTTVCQFKKVVSMNSMNHYGVSQWFDSRTPVCILTSALTARTSYYFTVPTTQGNWSSGTYKFTPFSDVPAESILYPVGTSWTNGPMIWQNLTIKDYGTAGMISSGTGTVDLATMGELNFNPTFYQASSRYSTSLINEYLNGPAYYYSNLKKQQPDATNPLNGIYGSLSADIQPYISTVYVPYILASNDSTALTFTSQIFLPSYGELSNGSFTHVDGAILDYYAEATATDRIKYDEYGTAQGYWTRTPTATGYSVFYIASDGAINTTDVLGTGSPNSMYVAPLFAIA